jgi:transcriptional regulator with XRE-family HTH domain
MKKSKIKSIYKKEYEVIIAKLKEARKKTGLTQSEVAEKFGRHQSYMAKIEGGERRLDIMEFIELAQMYGRSPEYFLKELKNIKGEQK